VGHLPDLVVLKDHDSDGCYINYLHISVLLRPR